MRIPVNLDVIRALAKYSDIIYIDRTPSVSPTGAFDVDHCGVNCATRPALLYVVIILCHYDVAASEEATGRHAQRIAEVFRNGHDRSLGTPNNN